LTISGTSAIFADGMSVSGSAGLIFTSASNTTLTLSNTAKTFGNITFSSNTTRTVNVNFASSNAITQTVGVFTVGNNVTLNLNGPANKVFGGISCGTNLRLYQLNNATVNGTANLGASTSLTISGAGYGVDNVVFNGPMSLTQTLIYARLRNVVFNAGATLGGLIELHAVKLNTGTLTAAANATILMYTPSVFETATSLVVSGSAKLYCFTNGQTFKNSFVLNTGALMDVSSSQTYQG
ncbi:hypothetical protein, partial [Xanthocytophaga flava]|uniref:hypothetical protein n=1 Tax=Xanthocytophaga flava TaxID=3048013 RepID=UPI0028D155F5